MRYLAQASLTLILCTFLFSCASEKPTGKTEAEVLYKQAKQFIDDERFLLATERLNLLRSQYPYSYYSTHAELLQADILFLQESYVESAAAYSAFRDYHPKYKKMAYVVWKLAESYYYQLPSTFDRDLTAANEAIKYYKELIQKYSGFNRNQEAKEKIVEAKRMLMRKDRYIADFYFKTEVYDAARYRYLIILKKHKDPELRSHAKMRVVQASLLNEEFDDCIKYSRRFAKNAKSAAKNEFQGYFQTCTQKYRETERKAVN